MTPEEKKALAKHVNAIAQILHADAVEKGLKMNDLGEIEQAVRQQVQQHVSPNLGIFLSQLALEKTAEKPES